MKTRWTGLFTSILTGVLGAGSMGCEIVAGVDRSQIDQNPPGSEVVCGDGTLATSEACDDGNTAAGDGCSGTCVVEDGFACTGTPSACADVDECAAGTDDCDENATCTNAAGSFTCACNAGFKGDGATCTNDDECADGTANCGANATCTDTPGSFTCTCDTGYTGDGVTCTNADECADDTNNCDANATCTDTVGSFVCACNPGFSGDGVTCTNDDECMLGIDDCNANATCMDTPGSFTCACNVGYAGDGLTCTNVDECMLGTDNCNANATCADTVGSFVCACNVGFSGDGVTCTNDDECMLGIDNCGANATCTDTPGSFTCACDAGYEGDGVTCTLLPASCKAIKAATPGATDGDYVIDPDGAGPTPSFTVRCDMTTAGGGFTLVFNDGPSFDPSLVGAGAETGYTTNYVNSAYATVPITADMLLDASDTAISAGDQEVRTLITGLPAATLGQTMRALFAADGPFYFDAEDNTNVTNTFAGGVTCGTLAKWDDYRNILCGTSVLVARDPSGPTCPGVTFSFGIDTSYSAALDNCAGWPQAPNESGTNYFPDNVRVWVR